MTETDLISSVAGLERLLSYSYQQIPMGAFATSDLNTMIATDTHGNSYSHTTNGSLDFGKIRSVNQLIQQLDKAKEQGVIDQKTRDYMMGEARFIRAYMYFGAVRALGGVPIITEPLDDKYDGGENLGLYVPRATEKETWDFVLSELDESAKLLPENALGLYRADKYCAYALQSRVALYAASVSKFWNRAPLDTKYKSVASKKTYMEASYADAYYQKCIDASKKVIDSGRYSLYGGPTSDREVAEKNLFELFQSRTSEFIFGKSYETGVANDSNGFDYNISPNQGHVRTTGWQWARYSVTLNMVDQFDNYAADGSRLDGTVKTRTDNNETEYVTQIAKPASTFSTSTPYIKYDTPEAPFADKDARFKAWVLYPGQEFRGMKLVMQGGFIRADGTHLFYTALGQTEAFGKTWYCLGAADGSQYSAFDKLDDQNAGNWYSTGFGRKKYLLNNADAYSKNPWYDLRYAEILLNYAEAYAESGKGDAALAKKYLNDIRHRAAFTDNIEPTVENVQHERLIELSFENDHAFTLHRRRENIIDNQIRKHALVPTLDLSGNTPKYIFVRTNTFHDDVDMNPGGHNLNTVGYYSGISNYQVNGFEPNPSQE